MNVLIYPRTRFQSDCRRLIANRTPIIAALGTATLLNQNQFFVADDRLLNTPMMPKLLLRTADSLSTQPDDFWPDGVRAKLVIGIGRQRGEACGWILGADGTIEPIHELRLPGTGMLRVPLITNAPPHQPTTPTGERWSRSAAAIGPSIWERMRAQTHAVIGAGRTGALVARNLAQQGVAGLALIDPDLVEEHNLGEMALANSCIGSPKADALGEELQRLWPMTRIQTVISSVTKITALRVAAAADVIWSAADNSGARLVTAGVAALFCRPLVDIGTAIIGHDAARTMGADIRLVPPDRCLLCCGGVSSRELAQKSIQSSDDEAEFHGSRPAFHQERAGSLASLNQLAVAAALRSYEDFLSARTKQTPIWLRLSFDASGQLSVAYLASNPGSAPGCFCHLTGLAERGLTNWAHLHQQPS